MATDYSLPVLLAWSMAPGVAEVGVLVEVVEEFRCEGVMVVANVEGVVGTLDQNDEVVVPVRVKIEGEVMK